jgi:hypothetical protein
MEAAHKMARDLPRKPPMIVTLIHDLNRRPERQVVDFPASRRKTIAQPCAVDGNNNTNNNNERPARRHGKPQLYFAIESDLVNSSGLACLALAEDTEREEVGCSALHERE